MCCWCRGAAKDAKEAFSGNRVLPLRTVASQKADFQKQQVALTAAKAKGIKTFRGDSSSVNGVSTESALNVETELLIPPGLHLTLGLANDII